MYIPAFALRSGETDSHLAWLRCQLGCRRLSGFGSVKGDDANE